MFLNIPANNLKYGKYSNKLAFKQIFLGNDHLFQTNPVSNISDRRWQNQQISTNSIAVSILMKNDFDDILIMARIPDLQQLSDIKIL